MRWQRDGLTLHTKKWLLGAGFLGAPPTSPKVWAGNPAMQIQGPYASERGDDPLAAAGGPAGAGGGKDHGEPLV